MEHKKNLLVTLANSSFLLQAKQLFSSVYWNAGWDGDYMLLAYEITENELEWFTKKGILVKKCNPLYDKEIGYQKYPAAVLSKFSLFTPDIKKWDRVIYLDADIIVRASLKRLTTVNFFKSLKVKNCTLEKYFMLYDSEEKNILKKEYNIHKSAFNGGVMAYNTDLITEKTYSELISLFDTYKNIITGDDSVLNLYFYQKWKSIPIALNIRINYLINYHKIPLSLFLKTEKHDKKFVIHFERLFDGDCINEKPWDLENPFHSEWQSNLEKADLIDLNILQKQNQHGGLSILYNSMIIELLILWDDFKRFLVYLALTFDRFLGHIGIFLKKYFPKLYRLLKRKKNT